MLKGIKNIISFSGGKDSMAMLLLMIEKNEPIHSVVYFDTEREFPEIKTHIKKVVSALNSAAVKLQTVRHWAGFDFLEARYGRPHPSGGWCAGAKIKGLNRYMRLMLKDNPDIVECIGFSADEQKRADRIAKKWPVRFPLIERGITEKMALEYCYDNGYFFSGIYGWMPSKRVSCYDCPKQSKKDWEAIKKHHPELIENKLHRSEKPQ
jgi:3'-phosphoadenosine 5'-phosphosulfate sulfotransferase (PAPS reductase)/FAD synthetase